MKNITLTWSFILSRVLWTVAYGTLTPQAGGMTVARSYGFEEFSRGHFTANKIQNVTNVKFRSLALILNFKFDHELF